MSRASILHHEFLAPGIFLGHFENNLFDDLIKQVTKSEEKWYDNVWLNSNRDFAKKAGTDYDITFLRDIIGSYDQITFNLITNAISLYSKPLDEHYLTEDFGYNILHYKAGGQYKWHYDTPARNENLKVDLAVCLIYLNDDYTGGNFEFKLFDINFKPQKNTIFIFPTGITYQHRSAPIIQGHKYVLRARLGTTLDLTAVRPHL